MGTAGHRDRKGGAAQGTPLTVEDFLRRVQHMLESVALSDKIRQRNEELSSQLREVKAPRIMHLDDAVKNVEKNDQNSNIRREVKCFKERWKKFVGQNPRWKDSSVDDHPGDATDFSESAALSSADGDATDFSESAAALTLESAAALDELFDCGNVSNASSDSSYAESFSTCVSEPDVDVSNEDDHEGRGTTDDRKAVGGQGGCRGQEAPHCDGRTSCATGRGSLGTQGIQEGGTSPGRPAHAAKKVSTAALAADCKMREAISHWTRIGNGEKPILQHDSAVTKACEKFCRVINVVGYIKGKEAGLKAVRESMRGNHNVAFGGDLDVTGMGLNEEEEMDYKKAYWLGHRAGAGIVLYPGPDIRKTGFMKVLQKYMEVASTSNDPNLGLRHQPIFESAPYLDEQLGKFLEQEVQRMREEADRDVKLARAEVDAAKAKARAFADGVKGGGRTSEKKSAQRVVQEAEKKLQALQMRASQLDWKKLQGIYKKLGEGLKDKRGTFWGEGKRMQTVNLTSEREWKPEVGEEYDGWQANADKWNKDWEKSGPKKVRKAKQECHDAAARLAVHGNFCHEMDSTSDIASKENAPGQEIHTDTVNPSHRKADLELDGLVSELAADILFNLLHPVTFLLSVGQDNFLQYVPGSHVLMEMDLDSQDKSSASESEARQKAREILGLKPGATLPVLNLSIPDGWLVAFLGHTLHAGAANCLGITLWRLHCYASVLGGFTNPRVDDEGVPLPIAGVLPNATQFPGAQTLMVGGPHLKKSQMDKPSSPFLKDFIEDHLLSQIM